MKNKRVEFVEHQQFRQRWLWGLMIPSMILPLVLFAYGLYQQLIVGAPWGDRPMSDAALIGSAALTLFVSVGVLGLLYWAKMTTRVDDRGLRVRFFPFHLSPQMIDLDRVKSVESRTYRPVAEYGGWGIRFGPGRKAYNVSGDRGVELSFENGKKLMIGSQRADELAAAIGGCRQVRGSG